LVSLPSLPLSFKVKVKVMVDDMQRSTIFNAAVRE
jgi:hypothetical protein